MVDMYFFREKKGVNMPLNKQRGNMYGFVTHTWNFIKGVCPHQCSYCYMKRWWPRMSEPRLDEKEFRVNPGEGKFIFVGSSIDMWADKISNDWQARITQYCKKYDNTYLFQSKNPLRFVNSLVPYPKKTILCTTIETNRPYYPQMGDANTPRFRARIFQNHLQKHKRMITIEPVMDFDLDIMLKWMKDINPMQINIGADSGRNNLPEPDGNKLKDFIAALKDNGFNVYEKDNLKRLLKE